MQLDLILKNGNIISGNRVVRRSIGIKNGRIWKIFPNDMNIPAHDKIDCTGLYILPGMIDIHVHLRDLQQEQKEDYESGTRAAAAGGITTVIDMPNSKPPILDSTTLEKKIERAKEKRFVNVGFYAGIPQVPVLDSGISEKIIGLKVYPHSPLSDVEYTPKRIQRCLTLAKQLELPLMFHPDIYNNRIPESIEDFFKIHNCETETNAVNRFFKELSNIGGHLHVCHISCAKVADVLSKARQKFMITGEVTPHHLFLNSDDFDYKDGVAKMLPPLRPTIDSEILWESLKGGVIDCVASDHAPHTTEEKRTSFIHAASGIPGLETTVPLMLTAVFQNKISWDVYLNTCCRRPAQIVGLHKKGQIREGFDADLVIISKRKYKIQGSKFYSKANNTPFEGVEVQAKPVVTIVGGTVVYRNENFEVDPGTIGTVPVRKR